ncbi:hypothetical protein CHL67_01610 [Prosthecochloris sp. GSB1]|uniref:glycosyltransferase n=1 Tax=Prosthecochloris sp. GSB1 TaxID=281093 RepID=UPI000B8CF27B|nr:glycosyltransferase [Prosthecochloris sp. GSB1]ASQ89790.1 hypothetical protein CHL67_01610 [Prosthecochloris sp. GSB1]
MTNLVKANQLFRKREYAAAVEVYSELAEKEKDFYLYFENLGLARKAMGRHSESLQDFARALELNPGANRSYYELKHYRSESEDRGLPELSIIVPVHNTEKYLSKCLCSILDQNYKDFELIVVNDGSTDQSIAIINKLMKKDERVILINNKSASGNPGTPRNQGIAIARGRYLGFVDSDDWIDPDYFGSLVSEANARDADIVFAGGFRNHKGNEVDVKKYVKSPFNDKDSSLYKYHESFMIWDKIYNTALVRALNIRLGETRAAVDVPFIFKAYYYLRNAAFCDEMFGYNYRRDADGSVTVKHRKSSGCDFEFKAYEAVKEWVDKCKVSRQYRDIVDFRMVNSYIYTLGIIDSAMRVDFLEKVRKQFRLIDRKSIEHFVCLTKKKHVLDKFEKILKGDIKTITKQQECQTLERDLKPDGKVAHNGKKEDSDSFSFNINASNKGILFFPDWSHTNPYQKLLYSSLADRFKIRIRGYKKELFNKNVLKACRDEFDVIHIHWLHAFMDISKDSGADDLLGTLEYAKKLGYQIVYTAHNIISHDSDHFERELRFRRKAQSYYDYILVHGEYAKKRVVKEIGAPSDKVYVLPHGSYEGYYPDFIDRNAAREILGIKESDFTFLFFGNIKEYKGVDELLKAYDLVRMKHANVRLIIAGRVFDKKSEALIESACDNDKSIIYKPGFIEEKEAQNYFRACDITVLPYKKILTSGAALLSFSFHVPVIAPDSGLIPEILKDGKQGFLYRDHLEMTRLMLRCVRYFNDDEWSKVRSRFDFIKLNDSLRWSNIVYRKPFTSLFADQGFKAQDKSESASYKYAIIRILGNDLPFRHDVDQTYRNLEFTLKNEASFKGACKIWVLNRIIDKGKKKS